MAGQTTIALNPAEAIEGKRDDLHFADHIESRMLTDAAGIGAGRVVQDGTTIGTTCAALTASGQAMIGVTVLDLSKEPKTPRNAQGDDVGVLKEGTIWMTCVDDMRNVKGTPYICFSGANAGLPQASAVGADLGVGISVVQGANTGLLGKFRINMP